MEVAAQTGTMTLGDGSLSILTSQSHPVAADNKKDEAKPKSPPDEMNTTKSSSPTKVKKRDKKWNKEDDEQLKVADNSQSGNESGAAKRKTRLRKKADAQRVVESSDEVNIAKKKEESDVNYEDEKDNKDEDNFQVA